MKYTNVKTPKWGNPEHTVINCEVDFDDLKEEYVPFSAVSFGDYEHTHQIYTECLEGKYGVIGQYTAPPEITQEPIMTLTDMILADPTELAKLKIALGL
jgi:hypothetical protein